MITSVSDIKFGEQIVLLLETSAIDKEKINKAIATLPPYWRPKQAICVEKLPQTETGKPDRASARKLAANKIDKA